jgi:hydrogenase-4 component E
MTDHLGFGVLAYDVAHLLGGAVLVLSFALLAQRRLGAIINLFAVQSAVLAAAAAWQGYIHHDPELYLTAAITFAAKAVIVPLALRRIIRSFDIHRSVETAVGIGLSMMAAVGLVALSVLVVLPIGMQAAASALTREDLALALSVILLGLLMMIARRNAISQVVGFMSLENGLILAAVGVAGMPLVVELVVAVLVLVIFLVFGVFLFQIRERFDTLDTSRLDAARGEGH